jgi:hypothetical protein
MRVPSPAEYDEAETDYEMDGDEAMAAYYDSS